MNKQPQQILKERILIFDGSMGIYLAGLGLKPEDFGGYEGVNEFLSVSRPDVIENAHREYFAAGADVVETNTFGANRFVLAEHGLKDRVRELNLAAVKAARDAAREMSTPEKPRFVAGSVGPTNKALFVLGGTTFDEFTEVYREQMAALAEGGVDLLLVETAHDISNIKAALAAASKVFSQLGRSLPVMVSVTMDRNNVMLSGQNTEAVCVALEHFPLLALGFNCSTGPKDMALRLETLSKTSRFPVLAMPNAGLPDENGKYGESPEEFAAVMKKYAAAGLLSAAGGCCGTRPEHIKALSAALKGLPPGRTSAGSGWAVSGVEALFYEEIEPPLLVGERNNSIGSKKFRDIVAAGKWDEAIEMARAQVRAGAHALDVCLSNPERNELEDANVFLPMLFHSVRVPVMIDTVDIKIMETALKLAPGQCLLNSVNFEFGEGRPRETAALLKIYGGKLVFGLIDENKEKGLPLTADRKLEIARRGYDFFTKECGLAPESIIFDALVFPVGVGREYASSAAETLRALERLKKEFPLSKTVLGLSNVSFGLPPAGREVLNAVFLRHAVKSGLDLAIVNVQKHGGYSRIPENEIRLAEDLLFARVADPAGTFAAYFREKKKSAAAPAPSAAAGASPEDRICRLILDGSKTGMREAVQELLAGGMEPLAVINGPVLKAMGEVGKLFSGGDLIVTEVLQSAEAVREAVSELEAALKAGNIPKRGKLLLATVKGDVHDIGKNLVNIIFESNGFEVVDLGVKVPPETIVAAALKEKPDFIGLSGLLVRSTEQMTITARELAGAGVSVPLLAGGAALTEKFVLNNMAPAYHGPVIYAPDAMDGLNSALKYITDGTRGAGRGPRNGKDQNGILPQPSPASRAPEPRSAGKYRPDEIPVPKDLERHFVDDCAPEQLFPHIDQDLFNLRFLNLKKTDAEKTDDTKKVVDGIKAEVVREKLIRPRGVYRFFRVDADGDSLLFYGPDGKAVETMDFPRQHDAERLCITDFFAPHGAGKDYTALLAVNSGEGVAEFARREREKGNYLRSYIVEALALSLAEALAEVLHYRIRRDWGFAEPPSEKSLNKVHYRGRRYSFGYPSCPDLAGQKKLFNLLKPESDVKVRLTDNLMMDPEAAISAFALHNPKAKYFYM